MARVNDAEVGGYHPMNVAGEPLRIFPTLVSTPGSYAWRLHSEDVPGPGMVYDENLKEWQEPNAGERERIMGLLRGSTEAWGVSEADRRRLIGAAIDVRAYAWLCRQIMRWRDDADHN